MVIEHYPQGWGSDFDQDRTRERRRADDRAYKDGMLPRERVVPGKKDRRRWCKGKVGVAHQTVWVKWLDMQLDPTRPRHKQQGAYWWQRCTACGKKLKLEFRPS